VLRCGVLVGVGVVDVLFGYAVAEEELDGCVLGVMFAREEGESPGRLLVLFVGAEWVSRRPVYVCGCELAFTEVDSVRSCRL